MPLNEHPEINMEQVIANTSLSIVIPARNERHNIGKLLHLLESEVPSSLKTEIIIADNSDAGDRTEEVVERFQSERPDLAIRLIRTEKGVSNARNSGAAVARNEYILFLDADARFTPGFICKALFRMVCGNFDAAGFDFDPNTGHPADRVIMTVTNAFQNIVKHTSTPVCTAAALLVRKSVHEQTGGFDPAMTFGEDSDYVQRIARGGNKFGIIPERIIFDMSRFESMKRTTFIALHVQNAVHYVLTGKPSPQMIRAYRKDRNGNPF